MNCSPGHIIFTSSGTEANNLAILGLREYLISKDKKCVVTSSAEHQPVLKSVEILGQRDGFETSYLGLGEDGKISVKPLFGSDSVLSRAGLVSVMYCNNEIGTLNPYKTISKLCMEKTRFLLQKMIHLGKNTRSTIISKGISAGKSQNSYRGLVRVSKNADGARNYSQCDSLLLGNECGAHTFPYMDIHNNSAVIEHEATTSKISEEQLFYCNQRGIGTEEAIGLIVNGYAKEVLNKLPMEFAIEAQKLLSVSLEGAVG